MAEKQDYFIGIDLGTTNSVVSWGRVVRRSGMFEPEVLPIEQIGEGKKALRVNLLPSVVYFEEDSYAPFVGEFARTDAYKSQPQRVVRSVKSFMGSHKPIEIGRKSFSPDYVSSLILNQLRAAIKDKDIDTNDVVITVPASFDDNMRADTIEAAKQAGFRVTNLDGTPRDILLDEPRAALHYLIYLQRIDEIPTSIIDLSSQKTILIFDLGGGTLDVSLHRVQADYDALDVNVEDIAIGRYTRIGGDNFDELIAGFFQKEFEEKYKLSIDSIPESYIRHEIKSKLLLEAELKKREINDIFKQGLTQKATIQQLIDKKLKAKIHLPNLYDNKHYSRELAWNEVTAIIEPLLGWNLSLKDAERFDDLTGDDANNIIYPILDVLKKAEKHTGSIPKIDAVFLNGGMTRFLPIQDRLEKFFGKMPYTLLDPDVSVAKGASLYHYSLHQGLKPKSVILAETIGMELNGGYVKHLVPAGTVLPMPKPIPIEGIIIPEGASGIIIPFHRGEGKEPKFPNVKMLEHVIKLPYACKKAEPLYIEVSMGLNKTLHLKGHLISNPEIEIDIKVESSRSKVSTPTQSQKSSVAKPNSENGIEMDIAETVERLFSSSASSDGQIKHGIEADILKAKNRSDFIIPIAEQLQKIPPTQLLMKKASSRRAILMLGALGAEFSEHPGVQNAFNALTKVCSQRINVQENNEKYLKMILDLGIVALGRLKNPAAEDLLLQILKDSKILPSIKGTTIISLAKITSSINALNIISKYITAESEILLRRNSAWAVGRMGYRDSTKPLPVHALKKSLEDLLYQIERETDSVTRQMMVYAISELSDQRNPSRREVFPEQYAKLSLQALERLQEKVEAKHKLTQDDQSLKKTIKTGLDMVYGRQLAEEQQTVLLIMRSKLDQTE